jgi:putative endonuclease
MLRMDWERNEPPRRPLPPGWGADPPLRPAPWKIAQVERRPSTPGDIARRRRANALGQKGELAALEYLEARGARLLARNYRCPGGEIDLVVLHEGELVAVEVKTRTVGGLGLPEDALTWWKLKRVARALGMFAFEARQDGRLWRIDAVVVDVGPEAKVLRVEHFKSVYEDEAV